MKDIIDMLRHRGYFIDQSQSLNLFMENANYDKLTSMHFYAWKSGLKTGTYYLRTKSRANAIKFTLKKEEKKEPVLDSYSQLMQASEVVQTKAGAQQTPKPISVVTESDALSPDELKALIAQAKEVEGDVCMICGS